METEKNATSRTLVISFNNSPNNLNSLLIQGYKYSFSSTPVLPKQQQHPRLEVQPHHLHQLLQQHLQLHQLLQQHLQLHQLLQQHHQHHQLLLTTPPAPPTTPTTPPLHQLLLQHHQLHLREQPPDSDDRDKDGVFEDLEGQL